MKSIIPLIIIGVSFFTMLVYPQQLDGEAFGAPVIKFSSIAGQNAVLAGGRFGWVIDSSIVLGGGIYGLVNNIKTNIVDPVSGQSVYLSVNYGGLELEYILFPHSSIHASIDMLFAGAGTTYSVLNKGVPHSSYYSQNLLLWEPRLNVEFFILNWLHLDTGLSYRFCSPPGTGIFHNTGGISLKDLNGLSAIISFKLGSF